MMEAIGSRRVGCFERAEGGELPLFPFPFPLRV